MEIFPRLSHFISMIRMFRKSKRILLKYNALMFCNKEILPVVPMFKNGQGERFMLME